MRSKNNKILSKCSFVIFATIFGLNFLSTVFFANAQEAIGLPGDVSTPTTNETLVNGDRCCLGSVPGDSATCLYSIDTTASCNAGDKLIPKGCIDLINTKIQPACAASSGKPTVSTSSADASEPPETTDIVKEFKISKPILEVNLPDLNFSEVSNNLYVAEDGTSYLYLPYIGEYISAIYKIGMVAISIIGVIMIVVVGVKITVMGGEERIAGFKKIGQVVIGLFIAWGSYGILYNINPDLINFKALKIEYIEQENLAPYNSLTEQDYADAAIGEGSPNKFQYFTECPIKDFVAPIVTSTKNPNRPNPLISKNLPRRLEFHEKMVTRQILKGPLQQRIIMASEAAVLCKIHYENCGVGTTNVLALSTALGGSYGKSEKCLTYSQKKGTGPCNSVGFSTPYSPKKTIKDATNFTTSYDGLKIYQIIRGLSCSSVKECNRKGIVNGLNEKGVKVGWPEQCLNTPKEATAKLFEILKSTGKWDPSWINELQPGDYYMPINWNSECNGAHSALFLGWMDPVKHIAWVQMGSGEIFINKGTVNLENVAVINISRPVEPKL